MPTVILCLIFLSFIHLNASGIEERSEPRGPITGRVSITGITFATEQDANEAVRRGRSDTRNPFVDNTCLLFHSTEEGSSTATITQIAPDIFLCCKHTAITLSNATTHFTTQGKMDKFTLAVRSGDAILRGAQECNIAPHPDADLALMQLKFAEGKIPECDFLPFAKSIGDGTSANGFVVSCGEVSFVGKESPLEIKRVLSIHPFQKRGKELISSLPGCVVTEQEAAMMTAFSLFVTNPACVEYKRNLSAITQTAALTFPTTETTSSLRLISVLRNGTSGSSLVIRQEGIFRLAGILTRGAIFPKAISDPSATIALVEKKHMRDVVYNASFLDLTPYVDWITTIIAKLSSSPTD